MGIDLGRPDGLADGRAAHAADVVACGHVDLEAKDAGPLDRVNGQQVHRERLGAQVGLDERVGEDARLDLFDAQRQVEGQGGVAVREIPLGLGEGLGQFGRIELQQARVGDRLGPQARRHLHDHHALLASHADRLDDGHLDLVGLLGGELFEFERQALRRLGGLKELDGNLLDAAGGRHRPFADVRIEDAGHLLVGGDFDLEARQFRPADLVGQRRAGPRDPFLDDRLLLDLDTGQRRQALGALGLGRPIDPDGGRGADERQDDGLIGGAGRGGHLGGGQERVDVHLDARLGDPDLPLADRRLGALEGDAVLARRLRVGLGEPQGQGELLRVLALLLDEQFVAGLGVGDDAGRLVAEGRLRQGHVAEAEQHLVPALLEDLELDGGLDRDDVLRDGDHAGDLGDEGIDGRLDLGGRGGLVACGLPEFLELFVRQEDAAALFLEDLAEFLVGDVDALFAYGLRLLGGRRRLGRGGRVGLPHRRQQDRRHQCNHNRPGSKCSHGHALGNGP